MSAPRSARCLFSRVAASTPKPQSSQPPLRPFHNSSAHHARRRSPFPSIKAEDMELYNKRLDERAKADYPAYTEEQRAALRARYTPEQYAVIEAAEELVDPRDLVTQGAHRTDPSKLPYLDDLSKIHPVIDKKPRGPEPTHDPHIRLRSTAEMADEFANRLAERLIDMPSFASETGDDVNDAEIQQMVLHEMEVANDPRVMFHADNPEDLLGDDDSVVAPAIPKLQDQSMKFASDSEDDDPKLLRLMQQTGWKKEQIRRLRVKSLVSHRVVNQTRMGKIQSIYYLTIAGNQNGLLGVGEGKSAEALDAKDQSVMAAIRNMKPIARYEDRTIYGEVEGKVGAVELKLSSRPPGFGVRCQQLIFEMARAAGITDLAARVTRSRNPMNTVKATWQALLSQRLPEDIARARGRKLVDVRKVYYGGKVY